MASVLAGNALASRAGFRRPGYRVAFSRVPPAAEMHEWWYEPEIPGVYRLVSVNGKRPPFFWQLSPAQVREPRQWLISGRAFLRDDRTWVVRLASGDGITPAGESGITLLQGTWAPAMTGQLAVRTSAGEAASWLANGRSLLMKGLLLPPGETDDIVELTLRFSRWR